MALTRGTESSSQSKATRETGVEMKREDIDLSGAFNDGYKLTPLWRVIWDRLAKVAQNYICLPADGSGEHRKYAAAHLREGTRSTQIKAPSGRFGAVLKGEGIRRR
jgi:hypothetical protein